MFLSTNSLSIYILFPENIPLFPLISWFVIYLILQAFTNQSATVSEIKIGSTTDDEVLLHNSFLLSQTPLTLDREKKKCYIAFSGISYESLTLGCFIAQSARAVEYTDCFTADG